LIDPEFQLNKGNMDGTLWLKAGNAKIRLGFQRENPEFPLT